MTISSPGQLADAVPVEPEPRACKNTDLSVVALVPDRHTANPVSDWAVPAKFSTSILNVSCSLWAAPGGIVSVGLLAGWAATGVVTHTAALVPYNAKTFVVGGGQGGVDAAATLPGTPIWCEMLSGANTSAVLSVANPPVSFPINGRYEVPPGGYLAIGTQTVASVVASIMWREVEP